MGNVITVVCGIVVVALLGLSVWSFATDRAQTRHCNESIGGLAVKESTTGRVVCIRRDGVLKVYER
jgi:hypothetical protein